MGWLHEANSHSTPPPHHYYPSTYRVLSCRLDWVASELLAPGEISFSADPQLGKAVILASSWEEMCDRAVEYFELRQPAIQGPPSTYAQTMLNLFSSKAFRDCKVASNETFAALEIPEFGTRSFQVHESCC